MSLQNSATPVLSICNLKVELPIPSGVLTAVKGLDLDLLPAKHWELSARADQASP